MKQDRTGVKPCVSEEYNSLEGCKGSLGASESGDAPVYLNVARDDKTTLWSLYLYFLILCMPLSTQGVRQALKKILSLSCYGLVVRTN